MRLDVSLYQIAGHRRSSIVVQAMAKGIRTVGDRPRIRPAVNYRPTGEIMVFYGLVGSLAKAIRRQQAHGGTAIYIDLGYWGRRDGGRYVGHHKIAVNSRHPTEYFQLYEHDDKRFRRLGVALEDWKEGGRHILIAGMGEKGATAEGGEAGEWERAAIAEVRKHSDRPITYRPKPSWKSAKPIEGTTFSPPEQPLEHVLDGAHAVVTHHSNVAVDGLVKGVPAFCLEGVASPLALSDLSMIENPDRTGERTQWVNDVSYCQWTVAEMAEGLPWRHLKDEGLVR